MGTVEAHVKNKHKILLALDRYISDEVAGLINNDDIETFRMDAFTRSKPVQKEAWHLIKEPYRNNEKSVGGFMKALNHLPISAYGGYYRRIQELTLVYDEGKLDSFRNGLSDLIPVKTVCIHVPDSSVL